MKYHCSTLRVLLISILILATPDLIAQMPADTVTLRRKEVTLISGDNKIHKGYLAYGNDTTLMLSTYKLPSGSSVMPESAMMKFDVSQINEITIRRKSWIKPAGIGLCIGALIGAAVAPGAKNPNSWFAGLEEVGNTLNYAFIGGAIGSGIGLVISLSPKKHYPIGGNKNNLVEFINGKRK